MMGMVARGLQGPVGVQFADAEGVRQAGIDVLCNKAAWRGPGTARQERWTPSTGTTGTRDGPRGVRRDTPTIVWEQYEELGVPEENAGWPGSFLSPSRHCKMAPLVGLGLQEIRANTAAACTRSRVVVRSSISARAGGVEHALDLCQARRRGIPGSSHRERSMGYSVAKRPLQLETVEQSK